jgi:hypothetical protein
VDIIDGAVRLLFVLYCLAPQVFNHNFDHGNSD